MRGCRVWVYPGPGFTAAGQGHGLGASFIEKPGTPAAGVGSAPPGGHGQALQEKPHPHLWVLVAAKHVPLPLEEPEFNLAGLSLAVCGGCSMEGTCQQSTSCDASRVQCNPEPLGLS